MAKSDPDVEDEIGPKWAAMSEVLDRLAERIADPDDFPVIPGSSLSGDDRVSHPFQVSQAVRHLINAAVDQLHGAKSLHVAGHEHLAVSSTLARAALENAATGLWILGPSKRDLRVERVLRWHARNYDDEASTVGHLAAGEGPAQHKLLVSLVAAARGLDAEQVVRGYKITTPIRGAAEFTSIRVSFLWGVASGFAHGRPWAYHGLLERETLTVDGEHGMQRLNPRRELSIWLPLEAVHLLGELLRLRDRRAGIEMPPMPDGSPDHTFGPGR